MSRPLLFNIGWNAPGGRKMDELYSIQQKRVYLLANARLQLIDGRYIYTDTDGNPLAFCKR